MKRPSLYAVASFVASGVVFAGTGTAATIDLTTLQLNGSASASPNDLSLTQGLTSTTSTAFLTTPVSTGAAFSSTFDATLTMADSFPQADGFAFVIVPVSDGTKSVGTGGGELSVDGIPNAAGVAFQSYFNDTAMIFSDGSVYNAYTYDYFDLGDQTDNVVVSISYAAGTLSYTASELNTGQTVSDSAAIDVSSLGPEVYIGLAGASGGSVAVEDISNLTVTQVSGVPEPSAWLLMIAGFGGMGVLLRRKRQPKASALNDVFGVDTQPGAVSS